MCSDYSRPPSPPAGRLKVEYSSYNNSYPPERQNFGPQYENKTTEDQPPQRTTRLQSGTSPPQQQEGQYFPSQVQQQPPPGFYYQQDTFPPREENPPTVSSSGHLSNQSGPSAQTPSSSGHPSGLPSGIPGTSINSSGHSSHPPRTHMRGKSFENDIRTTRQEQHHSTESFSIYHGPPPPRQDPAQWMGPTGTPAPPGPAIPYPGGGMPPVPPYYHASSPYMSMPGQTPTGQSWPITYGGQRPNDSYYSMAHQQPQQWHQQSDEGESQQNDPRYGLYYRPVQGSRPSQSSRPPQLVRTSALAQARSSWSAHGYGNYEGSAPSQPREQAQLAIDGDLMDMTKNWDVDEQVNCRRLVLFERIQDGPHIRLKFRSIHRDDYDQQTTVISCIFWKEENEYFVTSVDCITLLELIINQKFSVEEKNRVRRNLEVCKPKTISKSKKELSTFFKLIMKFEPPRPRNIEKDVKVFPWAMLGQALTKIVSKYSASYFNSELM